jgi:hypothetical protein
MYTLQDWTYPAQNCAPASAKVLGDEAADRGDGGEAAEDMVAHR